MFVATCVIVLILALIMYLCFLGVDLRMERKRRAATRKAAGVPNVVPMPGEAPPVAAKERKARCSACVRQGSYAYYSGPERFPICRAPCNTCRERAS